MRIDTAIHLDTRESLGDFIKRERLAREWSQQRLGDKAGISHTTIGRIERGQIEPEMNTMTCLLGALEYELRLVV